MLYHLTPIVRALIIANVGIYFLQDFSEGSLTSVFALWPVNTPLFHVWQLISYAFLHGGFSHLFFNMFGLFMFGPEIERTLGTRHFLIYYFVCVVGAALLHLLVTYLQDGVPVATVGASGGIFGILLAFGMFFPQRKLMLLFPPIPMPAWLFVTLYGAAELLMGVFGTMQGVAHFAHLGGMLAGFLLLFYWRTFSRDS
ncbi:MAG TPA: rhomboid family intramembrane serine protease [Steroidobacteraceae bacterium]|nr:rhomboid family intramembrane serine protease [Steroidobacteraceae bacterium]